MFANHVSVKGLIPKIYKELIHFNSIKNTQRDIPGGPLAKNQSAKVENMDLIPDQGRFHMWQSS